MRHATNCFLIDDEKGTILLSMKKRGLGVGKWNGAGGKVAEGETALKTAAREVKEEIGVAVKADDLEKVAEIIYTNPDPNWGMSVDVFIARNWRGTPEESEEMKPEWFELEEVPYGQAWPDLVHWLPRLLVGEKLKANFVYKEDGELLDTFEVAVVDGF